ncbi:tigger transposable element-derived protein 4-like, partial [Aphis craccivora]
MIFDIRYLVFESASTHVLTSKRSFPLCLEINFRVILHQLVENNFCNLIGGVVIKLLSADNPAKIVRFRLRLQPIPIFLLAFIAFVTVNAMIFSSLSLHVKYGDHDMHYRTDDINGTNFFIFTNADKVIKPNLTKNNSIIIFDDVICGPQFVIREYFSICRHSGASSAFYLAQTYSKIPKQLVRDNSNFLIILKQDDTHLRHIFNDHSSADMDFIEFRKISHLCWNHSDY